MELNEKGEVIVEEKQKGRLMGKLLQRKQEQVQKIEEKVVPTQEPVKQEQKIEEKPVEQTTEPSKTESDKEQVIKLAFAYLNWAELTDLAKLKVVEVEKENASLTVLLKQTILAQEKGEE